MIYFNGQGKNLIRTSIINPTIQRTRRDLVSNGVRARNAANYNTDQITQWFKFHIHRNQLGKLAGVMLKMRILHVDILK